jgi:hypothetical protein
MTGNEVAKLVLGTANGFLSGMDRAKLEEPDRLDAFLRAIEESAAVLRSLMVAASDGPDEPTPAQIRAVLALSGKLVTIGASACAMLVTLPITAADLGPLHVVSEPLN